VAYTGFSDSGVPDCSNGTSFFSAASPGTTKTPTATTTTSGDWQVQLVGVAPPSGNDFNPVPPPAGLTVREYIAHGANAGVLLTICDSNGSVGSAGTLIGGTTYNFSAETSASCWSVSHTIGLAPPTAAPSNLGLPMIS
jgi:hypothetical protein